MRYVWEDRLGPDPRRTRRTDEHPIHEATPTLRLPFASNPHRHTAAMHPSKRAAKRIGHAGTTQAQTGTTQAQTGTTRAQTGNGPNRHRASGTDARAPNESRTHAHMLSEQR